MRRLTSVFLVLSALIVAVGCGGETGGLPSGIGGTLISRKISSNLITINVSDAGVEVPSGTLAAIGRNAINGLDPVSFEVVLKGASFDGKDVFYAFNLGAAPAGDGQPLFEADVTADFDNNPGTPATLKTILLFPDGANFRDSRTGAVRTGMLWINPLYNKDLDPDGDGTDSDGDVRIVANPVAKPGAFRYVSPQDLQFTQQGTFDVIVRFFSVPKDQQTRAIDDPTKPYYNVLLTTKATITSDAVFLSPPYGPQENDNPSLQYSKGAVFTTKVKNISPAAQSIKVRVGEVKLSSGSDETQVGYEVVLPTGGETEVDVEIPIINRLRAFRVTAQAFLDPAGLGAAVAAVTDPDSYIIPVQADSLTTNADLTLQSRISSLSVRNITLSFNPDADPLIGAETFQVTANILGGGTVTVQNKDCTFTPSGPNVGLVQSLFGLTGGSPPAVLGEEFKGTFELVNTINGDESPVPVLVTLPVDAIGTTVSGTGNINFNAASTDQELTFNASDGTLAGSLPPKFGSIRGSVTEVISNGSNASPLTFVGEIKNLNQVIFITDGSDPNVGASLPTPLTTQVNVRGFQFRPTVTIYSAGDASGIILGTATGNAQAVSTSNQNVANFVNRLALDKVKVDGVDLTVAKKVTRGSTFLLQIFGKSNNGPSTQVPAGIFTISTTGPNAALANVSAEGLVTVAAATTGNSSTTDLVVSIKVDYYDRPGNVATTLTVSFTVKANLGSAGGGTIQ